MKLPALSPGKPSGKSLAISFGAWLSLSLAVSAAAADLPAALRAALDSDPTLAAAVANRDAAFENIEIARARLRPQITLQNTTQFVDQTTSRSTGTTDFSGQSRSTQLTLRQGLYRPRDRVGVEVGKLQAEYGEAQLVSAQSDLWNRTSQAWIDVLAAQARRDVYARAVESVERSAEQEKRRFAAGDGTRDAVAEALAQVAQARSQLAEAKLELDAKLRAFNLLTRLEVKGFEGYKLPSVEPGLIAASEGELLARVLGANPQLAAARLSESAAGERVKQASADHWPTVDFVASMARAQNDSTNTLDSRYRNTQFGVQLVVPIYAGGGVSAAQRQATAAYASASAEAEAVVQNLKTQFVGEWNSQDGLKARTDAARELVNAAREQRLAIELGIRAGVRTWADLGAIDLTLSRRESDYVNSVGALLRTQARLLSLLPADDPAWKHWAAELSHRAKR